MQVLHTVHLAFVSIIYLTAMDGPVAAAGSGETTNPHYQRARELPDRYRDKVFRDRLEVDWIGEEQFTYRVSIGPKQFERVDVDVLERKRVVRETNDAGSSDGPVELPPMKRAVASRDSSERITITFQNETDREVILWWITPTEDWREYHRLAAGEVKKQSTWMGHTWLATTSDKRPLQAFSASVPNGIAKIQATDFPPQLSNKRQRAMGEGKRERISPDGKYEIITKTIPGDRRKLTLVESSPKDGLHPKVLSVPYDKPGDNIDRIQIFLKEIETDEAHPIDDKLFPNPYHLSEFRWASDSSFFTFLYNERGHQKLQVIAIDTATRLSRILVDERSDTFIDYSSKSFHEYLDDTNELIWASERDGWCHLYLYDLKAGVLKQAITQGEWVVREIESIDRQRRRILFTASGLQADQDPYFRHLCRVDFDGKNFRQLTAGNGDHEWSFSPEGNYFIDTYSRIDMPPVTELRSCETGELIMELERADDTALREAGWQVPQAFVAKGRDGKTDIHGMIVRPSHFQRNRSYPVIEAIYAGPHSSFTPKRYGMQMEFCQLAELGFIVVKLDGMGTSHRSKAFHDVCWKNLADSGFRDRRLWIEAAAAAHPELDTTRIGIYGGSAGGQSALGALLFHGDFYDCAVADCGCHDNRMDKIWWNEQWMGWPIGPHYKEQSNVTNAHRLTGKLLLIVGELDTNVDPASTLQVVDALIRADKDFEMLLVPGGKHGVGSQPYGRRRTWDFFSRHLLGLSLSP